MISSVSEKSEDMKNAMANPIKPDGNEIHESVAPMSPANFTSPIPSPLGRTR